MLWTLIRKEIVSHVLSLRFGVTFILFILLVFASIYVTAKEYQKEMARHSAFTRVAADHLAEVLREEDGWDRMMRLTEWDGRMDAVPVPRLASVAQGLCPSMPVAVISMAEESRSISGRSESNPLTRLLRVPDLVYVVSVVLSLLAILFAFDSVCGEKESGTLRLMLSNAVPRDLILLSKWIAGYLVLVVPFLVAVVGGLVYARWQEVLELDAENLQRLGLLALVACLYISVFFTLSLFISTITHRSATALFLCLLVWVVWILAVPNLAPVAARIASPAPSEEKIKAEKRAVETEIELRIRRLTLATGELGYGEKIQREREKLREEGKRRKAAWDRFLEKETTRQIDLARTLGRLSPAACWTYAATTLTGTGPAAYRRFEKAKQRLTADMFDFQRELIRNSREADDWAPILAEQVPRLDIATSTCGGDARIAISDIVILAVLNVVLFMSAFLFFLRYDVR